MGKNLPNLKLILFLIVILNLILTSTNIRAQDQIIVEYFHKPTCIDCGQYLNSEGFDALIDNLKNEYTENVYIDWLDVNHPKIMERLIDYNITLTPAVIFNGKYKLIRGEITMESLREIMDDLLEGNEILNFEGGITSISVSMIIIAGLVDGINPCAISLLVFFLSFLTGLKRSKEKVFKMGLAYILGLYAVYFALGLGLVNTISFLGIEHPIGKIGAFILFFLGLINIRDAITFETPILKFPKFATPTVKKLTSKAVFPAALILGGFVSLFEFACSGGVYIGILVLLSAKTRFLEGLIYLIIYNFFFVLPLIIVLILGTQAENLVKIDRWRVINRRYMKIISGLSMILFAITTYYWAFV